MKKAVVIGGSGGIGFALVKALLSRYPSVIIVATWHRQKPVFTHPNLQWVRVDITQDPEIDTLAASTGQIDCLINAVGLLHSDELKPEKQLQQLESDAFLRAITINTLPTLMLARAFEASFKQSERGIFAVISAKVGSIEDNKLGGWYSYRCSKAALNMAIKNISIEWRRKLKHVCVLALHPGTTDTALSEPFQHNVPEGKLFSPNFTAAALLEVIARSGATESGRFFAYDGEELPW